jgi:hypothetical protein
MSIVPKVLRSDAEPVDTLDLTEDQRKDLLEKIAAGKGVMCNFDVIGPMIRIDGKPNGRGRVECVTNDCQILGPYHAEIVRDVIAAWSAALAEYDSRQKALN